MKYFLNIDAFDCSFRLFINNIPVLDMRRGGNLNADMCINKFMINGKNEIQCFIKPFPSIEKIPTTANVKLTVYTALNPKDERNEVAQVNTPEFKEADESPLPKDYTLSGYFNGDKILDQLLHSGLSFKDTSELRMEVMNEYNKVWDLFKNKKLKELKEVFLIRDKQLALLLNQSEAKIILETEEDYSSYMNSNELELWTINKEKIDFKLYFNGKLVCYELKNGNSPICFVNNIEKYAVYIPLFFNRNTETKKLEIIR